MRLISPSPRGRMQIAGVQIGCVYDTGAETSIISSSVFHSQLKEKLGENALKKMDGLFMNVVGIGGLEIPIEGYIEVPVLLDGQSLRGSFLITKDSACRAVQLDQPILIGCNILRKLACDLFEKFPASGVSFVKDTLSRSNPSLSTIEGSQVLEGNSVELLLQNKSEYEVCLPLNTPVAEAQSACRKQEVCIDLEEDNVIVSVYDVIADHKSNEVDTNQNLIVEDSSGVSLPVGIKLDDLSAEEEEKVAELLNEHKDVFSKGSFDLGECVVLDSLMRFMWWMVYLFVFLTLTVVAQDKEEDVYQIRPVLCGHTKWVNRRRLTLDPRVVSELFSNTFPVSVTDNNDMSLEGSDNDSDSDSDDSDDDVPYWLLLARGQERPVHSKTIRRSTRSTRGVNRNPFRLPTSAVTGLPV